MFTYSMYMYMKRIFYCWTVCLRPFIKKFKLLFVFLLTYFIVFCGGFFIYCLISEVVFWNKVAFSSTFSYFGNELYFGHLNGSRYAAAAEMPWSRKYDKNKFYYTFADLKRHRFMERYRSINLYQFFTERRSRLLFNRIDVLARTKLKSLPNKHFPAIGERMFYHWFSGRIPKNLYVFFPTLQKKPSGRFAGLKGFSIPNPKYIVKRPEVVGGYITYLLPKGFYWETFFWNKAIHNDNLLGYRIMPVGVLPVDDCFFTKQYSQFADFLKGGNIRVFDFRFLELSLLHPGLVIDKRGGGQGMVVAFVHPAFYKAYRNVPVNDFFRDYIRQMKVTGLKDSALSLYLSMTFSDPDLFCYYLPRAIKFVFIDYSSAQVQSLYANRYSLFPTLRWNSLYIKSVYGGSETAVQLQTAHSFIYRIARKQ